MISNKMKDALNDQLGAETYSAYLYWQMSAWFEGINMPGFANWMRVQAQEEMTHAMKFYSFLVERGGNVVLQAIDAPASEWDSALAIFEAAYKHECYISSRINDLVNLAIEEKDHATNAFLQWFVNEQVEEEASADGVVQKLKLMGDAPGGMFMMDQEMAARVFTPPAAEK